jgi:hypothetical protein
MAVDPAIMDLARALARRRARQHAAKIAAEPDLGPSIVPRHDEAAPLSRGAEGDTDGRPSRRALRPV